MSASPRGRCPGLGHFSRDRETRVRGGERERSSPGTTGCSNLPSERRKVGTHGAQTCMCMCVCVREIYTQANALISGVQLHTSVCRFLHTSVTSECSFRDIGPQQCSSKQGALSPPPRGQEIIDRGTTSISSILSFSISLLVCTL